MPDGSLLVARDDGKGNIQLDKMKIPPLRLPKGEFCDNDHAVSHDYYDILERGYSYIRIKKEMLKLIERDPDFYDPYIVVADILESELKNREAQKYYEEGYRRAKNYLQKHAGGMPAKMEWGFLENRHLMRIFAHYAYSNWKYGGGKNESLEIFRWLLKANPNDNQGVRYDILALRESLKWNWREKYEAWDGNVLLGLDPRQMDAWFDRESKKYPDEFNDFWKYADSLE